MKREFIYLWWYLLICVPIIVFYVKFSLKAKREWLTLTGRIRPDVLPGEQEREYTRLESTFPVEFQRIEEDEEREFDIHQGFTKNLSKSGMCIETLMIKTKELSDMVPNETKLKLIINLPSEAHAIIASATVRWIRKTEEMAVDRYAIGVSYDDIPQPDLEKIIRYVLWFKKKPDVFGVTVAVVLILMTAFFITLLISSGTRTQLERKLQITQREASRLMKEREAIRDKKDEIERDLESVTQKYIALQKTLSRLESERAYQRERLAEETQKVKVLEATVMEEEPVFPEEEAVSEDEEETLETPEETPGPVVEIRTPVLPEEEIVFEPNITKKMVETEKDIYRAFRDYILREDMQLLDRYCSDHKTSIYHAASLFALAELRYKNRHIKEMTMKAYRDVIRLYPRSKYASYASHRLEQLERNLPYGAYSLRYFYREYNLPPLFDYRELEPYKE